MLVDQGLESLSQEAAWNLLTREEIGRVGLSVAALPVILPVNFAVIDGCIVFRTAPGSKLAAAATGAVVAFEVDGHDRISRSGWSVLVVGRSEVIHDLDETFKVLAAKLDHYVDGRKSSLVRIRPEFVSGRRVVHAVPDPTAPAVADVVNVSDSVDQTFAEVCRSLTEASSHLPGSVVAVPQRGGDEAVTEFLLISKGDAVSPTAHAQHVEGGRSQLADVAKRVVASAQELKARAGQSQAQGRRPQSGTFGPNRFREERAR